VKSVRQSLPLYRRREVTARLAAEVTLALLLQKEYFS
jgi:hypothetical protein